MRMLTLVVAAALLALTLGMQAAIANPNPVMPAAPSASRTSLAKLQAQPVSRDGARSYAKAEFREAEDDFKEALAVNPHNYRAAYLLGMTYLNRERWESARDSFRRALESGADPLTQAHIYNGIAYSYEASHQTRMAHHYYHLACHANKGNEYAQKGATRTEYDHHHEAGAKLSVKNGSAATKIGG